jgi:hypothetical protein
MPACRLNFGALNSNHQRNFSAFRTSLQRGIHIVIVDNTNILCKYYEHYEDAAKQQG